MVSTCYADCSAAAWIPCGGADTHGAAAARVEVAVSPGTANTEAASGTSDSRASKFQPVQGPQWVGESGPCVWEPALRGQKAGGEMQITQTHPLLAKVPRAPHRLHLTTGEGRKDRLGPPIYSSGPRCPPGKKRGRKEPEPRAREGEQRAEEAGHLELVPCGSPGRWRAQKHDCALLGVGPGPRVGENRTGPRRGNQRAPGRGRARLRGSPGGPCLDPTSGRGRPALGGGELRAALWAGWCTARGSRRRGPGRADRQNVGAGAARSTGGTGCQERPRPGWDARAPGQRALAPPPGSAPGRRARAEPAPPRRRAHARGPDPGPCARRPSAAPSRGSLPVPPPASQPRPGPPGPAQPSHVRRPKAPLRAVPARAEPPDRPAGPAGGQERRGPLLHRARCGAGAGRAGRRAAGERAGAGSLGPAGSSALPRPVSPQASSGWWPSTWCSATERRCCATSSASATRPTSRECAPAAAPPAPSEPAPGPRLPESPFPARSRGRSPGGRPVSESAIGPGREVSRPKALQVGLTRGTACGPAFAPQLRPQLPGSGS